MSGGSATRWLGACWLGLAAAACTGTETGNPSFEGELAYNAYSSDVAVAALRDDPNAAEGAAHVQSAWLVLGDVRFVPADDCEEGTEAAPHATGLGAGDHAVPTAAHSSFQLDAGRYCALELPLLRAGAGELPAGAPGALLNRSVVLEGSLDDGTPLRIESTLERSLFVAADDGAFELSPDVPGLLIAFDVAAWLDGLPLDGAERDGDGTVVISNTLNTGYLAQFEDHLGRGVLLFRDADGSGVVSPSAVRLGSAR